MNWQGIKIRALKWGRRILVYGTAYGALSFALAFGVLQLPVVQEYLVKRLTNKLSAISGYNFEFDSFYLVWYDRLEITGLRVTGPDQQPMIEAGRLYANFTLRSLYQGGDLYLDAVALQGASVNLQALPLTDSTTQLNFNQFIGNISRAFSSGKPGGRPAKVHIGEVEVQQSHFSYHHTLKDSIPKGFDYNHFRLAVDEGDLDGFSVIGDTIQFQVNSLQILEEKTQFSIRQLSTYFRISQGGMEFLGLNLDAEKSHVSDTVIFRFNSQADLSDFNNKVSVTATLKDTRLDPTEIAHFAPGVEQWKESVVLNGKVTGRVNHFVFSNMDVQIGKTSVRGRLEMDGLPSLHETFINARFAPSVVNPSDIAFLLPTTVSTNLASLGTIRMNGSFIGFITDFVANGDFSTRFGNIQSDINYKITEDIGQTSYSGNLQLHQFDLGGFLRDTVNFQQVELKGRIAGKGFTEQAADFILNGDIESIGLLGYNYQNIHSNARFANQFFNGALTIDDPNLQFDMKGSIDLRGDLDRINVEARLDTALLKELKLSREEIFLQTYLQINSRGLNLDSIVGNATFRKTRLQFRDESIQFDSIRIRSAAEKGIRSLDLRSSIADVSLSGNFYYSTLFGDLQTLVHEFLLNLKNDPVAIQTYYAAKKNTIHNYKANITATVHNPNPLFDVLDLNLYASPETLLQGEFSNGTSSVLKVFTHIDTLEYEGNQLTGNEIEFDGSKIRDSTRVLAQLTVRSDRQHLNKAFSTKNFFSEAIWDHDHMDLSFDLDQDGVDNKARLRAEVDFLADSTQIRLLPSTISILKDTWQSIPGKALMKGKEWAFYGVGFRHEDQFVGLDGQLSNDPLREFKVDIRHFDLSLLNYFTHEKFKGRMDAEIKGRDLYDDLFLENQLSIDSLTINQFLVGDIRGNNTRNASSRHFNMDLVIDRLGYRIVDVKGYYDPSDAISPLHTKAILKKANLKLLEPVVKDLFTQLDGTLTGEYAIEGTFSAPHITGEAKIEGGQVMINYLRTLYKVTGTLGMTPQQIQFNNFDLTDAFNNKGRLQGYVAHRNFSKMRINLDASFTNFQVLNTGLKDNNLFYGQAFGTGTLNILGPVSNLKISATARTNRNTRLFIPVGTTLSEEKKEFIQFTNFASVKKTKKAAQRTTQKKELTGLTLDLDIDVTPEAYGEIIFDIKSGDIIRGRGRGDIKLQIDTKGEFNMFGVMEFTEGGYNFTLYDIINKEFKIKPGSRITWYGDPYEGNLAITASYSQYTSMVPVLQDQSVASDPNIRRKYPVEVLLKLDGPMLSPLINFDIEAKDLPDNVVTADGKSVRLRFEFNAFKTKLDEQELKRQVFSLIILRKLSPTDAFATSGSLANSVSELLSNQLSYWLSQVDQNLEIDLDLGTLDTEAFNTFQLRLSYSFLGGRLRVSKDGNFGNQPNRSELSTIAGDWTVDYLLTPDGKFKVKMYSRSTVNQLQSSLNTQTAAVTTGASLLYTENFNEFKDLLISARERRRRELEKNPPKDEESNP